MNNLTKWKSNAKRHVRMYILRLKENISVPVVILLILSLGSLSGIGFYMKSLALKEQLAWLEANMQFAELQSLRMSNEWLKNRVAVLQEERAVLLDTAVADLDKKSRIIESILSSVGVDIKVQLPGMKLFCVPISIWIPCKMYRLVHLCQECLPQDSAGAMIRLMANLRITRVWISGVERDRMSRLQPMA